MTEKILNTAYKKLCEGFKTNFLTREAFEKEISAISNSLLDTLVSLIKGYEKLKNSTNPSERSGVVRISKDEYVLERFNSDYFHNYSFASRNKYNIDHLLHLKSNNEEKYESYAADYEKSFERGDNKVVIPLIEFIASKFSSNDIETNITENQSIKKLFWGYFNEAYLANYHWRNNRTIEELLNSPEMVIQNFKKHYLLNIYIQLLDLTEKYLNDETFSGFETYTVNVGKRHSDIERGGWRANEFQVLNKGEEYSFSHSSKDEKRIDGEFINIFIFSKKHLIKLSITLNGVERTPYIIYRDCEKISLKNECEIVIVKHHGNETIIFDTRKEVLAFQLNLIEIREGMGRK